MPVNRTTRVRLLSQPLLDNFTPAQTILACDVAALHAAAGKIEAGQLLTEAQVVTINSVNEALGLDHLPDDLLKIMAASTLAERKLMAARVETTADSAAVEQCRLLASTVVNALRAENWAVTVVDGGNADRHTGIEASRGCEHLVMAVKPGEVLADQASVDEADEVIAALAECLRDIGCAVIFTDGGGQPMRP
jgi:hypothetical protein